ncbi:MAG: signal peptidase I [Armatimonadota bacterium]|nr:signal peptidase I [Armatimonadota bacterium]
MKPYCGNAARLALEHRGWFLGHFVGEAGQPLHCEAVEIKWAEHRAGERRAAWSQCAASSLSILIRGRFRIQFPDEEFVLAEEGDFVVWGPDVPHTWHAEEDSLVLTVRWPSHPVE